MRRRLLQIALIALCPILAAQQTMNNDSIITMVKAGLSDDIILASISSRPCSFDISTSGLVALKAAGVSDKVVAAVITKGATAAPTSAPAPAAPAASADPNDPSSPHDVGVYLMTTGPDGKPRMTFIDRAGEAGVKTANVAGMAFTYGIAKAKLKAEIPGTHAPTRTPDARPVFYMYFPEMSGLGSFGGTDMISSPNQFSLLLLEVKKDHRETEIAKMGFASSNVGADQKRSYLFTSQRIKSGMYKVTPNEDLRLGEYAFLMATQGAGKATGTQVVIYDFGVDR
jgi:hypothetical protein